MPVWLVCSFIHSASPNCPSPSKKEDRKEGTSWHLSSNIFTDQPEGEGPSHLVEPGQGQDAGQQAPPPQVNQLGLVGSSQEVELQGDESGQLPAAQGLAHAEVLNRGADRDAPGRARRELLEQLPAPFLPTPNPEGRHRHPPFSSENIWARSLANQR